MRRLLFVEMVVMRTEDPMATPTMSREQSRETKTLIMTDVMATSKA